MNDITPDPTGEGSAWQPVTPAPGSDAERQPEVRVSGPHMAPDGIGGWVLKDGPYMSIPLPAAPAPVEEAPVEDIGRTADAEHLPRTESPMKVLRSIAGIRLDGDPDDEGLDSEMDIDDAFRLLSDVVESAREAIASQSVDPAPADQLDQLPDYRLLGQQNRDLTEAARRIVDLEEERDALKARVEELTTDLQTAKDALQEWMEEHRLTEEAGGIVERLNQEADGYRAQIAALTARVAALEWANKRLRRRADMADESLRERKTRVLELLQERDDALGRAALAERRAVQAEERVRELREALEAISATDEGDEG